MDIVQHAKSRYSTKVFEPGSSLTPEQYAAVKDLLRLSPSSTNSQPWHFILAQTPQARQQVAQATQGIYQFNQAKVLDAACVVVFCVRTEMDDAYQQHLLDVDEAAGRLEGEGARERQYKTRTLFADMHRFEWKDTQHWMEKQVYLNAGSFLLGVSALGLDAVPIEGFDARSLDEVFGLRAKGYTSLLLVAVGKRSTQDFNAGLPKSRLPEWEIFTELN